MKIADFDDKDEQNEVDGKLAELNANLEEMTGEERAIWELSEPIPVTDLMVRRPCCFLSVGFLILFIISAFSAAMGWLIPQDPYERDYFVWGDKYVNAYDKTLLASRELLATVDG